MSRWWWFPLVLAVRTGWESVQLVDDGWWMAVVMFVVTVGLVGSALVMRAEPERGERSLGTPGAVRRGHRR